jgi:hypothetical protein
MSNQIETAEKAPPRTRVHVARVAEQPFFVANGGHLWLK